MRISLSADELTGIAPELAVRRGREADEFYKRAFGAIELLRAGGTDEHEPARQSAGRR